MSVRRERSRASIRFMKTGPRFLLRALTVDAELIREGSSGRLVWRADYPFETPIGSLAGSSNTVQNGSCREPSEPISSPSELP